MAEDSYVIDGEEFTHPNKVESKYVLKKPWGTAHGNLKVYIPTLMPGISQGEANFFGPHTVSKTIFCNSKECPITPMKKIKTQNFKTAKRNVVGFQRPEMDFGASIIIQSNDHDMQSITMTIDVDNSTYHQ